MIAKKQAALVIPPLLDAAGFLLSIWFVYSVIQNARALVGQNIKNAPATYALILALMAVGFAWQQGKKISILGAISLAVLATAAAIWAFGLSATTGWM